MDLPRVYFITSETIGRGNDELGAILMRSFLKNLATSESAPHSLVFMNGGVKLTCEGAELVGDIEAIAARGTAVWSCGTCLDFYNLKEELKAGQVGGMVQFIELFSAHPTVTIG